MVLLMLGVFLRQDRDAADRLARRSPSSSSPSSLVLQMPAAGATAFGNLFVVDRFASS